MTQSTGTVPPLANRRPALRRRVLYSGVIAYEQGSYSFGCRIRDLTPQGARVNVPVGQHLPPEVYLLNLHDRTAHKAKIAWYRGNEAGLTFLSSFDPCRIDDPELAYLTRLWLAVS